MQKASTVKKQRTRFDVIREIGEIDAELDIRNDPDSYVRQPGQKGGNISSTPDIELMKNKAQLKHELKMFDARAVDGEEGEAVKKHWQREAQEANLAAKRKKKEAKANIESAKKKLAQEMDQDPDQLAEIIAKMTPAARKKVLAQLNKKNDKKSVGSNR